MSRLARVGQQLATRLTIGWGVGGRVLDFVRYAGSDTTLRRADRAVWGDTESLPDLCALTIEWLGGQIGSQPGYYGPVDVDEDDAPGLTTALMDLNRAGFLTRNSQAGFDGVGYDGAHWTQLASVTGYAEEQTVDRLRRHLRERAALREILRQHQECVPQSGLPSGHGLSSTSGLTAGGDR